MSDQPLIAGVPWTDAEARLQLIDRAVAAFGFIGGTRVRILLEPLMKVGADGSATQSIRVLFDDAETASSVDGIGVFDSLGNDLVKEEVPAPRGSVRLLVPAVHEETGFELSIPDLGSERIPFSLTVQREWTVHVVHHSHFDFGYTDPQPRVFAGQRSYLDSAMDLVRETADWPEASRFRWAVESLWAFSDWARRRPVEQVQEFIDHVKNGSIELTALPYILHLDTCSTDELHELLREAQRIRQEYGVEFTTAMQTDVPGQGAGLPDALHDAGVRYLSVAHNWAGRSMPHLNGGENMPRLFRWKTPAGNSILVWMTDSPHGLAYEEGPVLGFTESYEQVENLFPAYLTALANNGYPFPPGLFWGHGIEVEGRDPYPWDILHLRTMGYLGDNGPARLKAAEIVREWNETWTWPKLRMSRNEDFFVDAEERLKDEIQTFEGDWGDWWVDGVGSAAVPMAMTRDAQNGVAQGQSLSRMAAMVNQRSVATEYGEAQSAYASISLFDEHSWGARFPWKLDDQGGHAGESQWQWKVASAHAAKQRSDELIEHAGSYLGAAVAPMPEALASFAIANTAPRQRTSTARIFLKESLVPFGTPFEVHDARTGKSVPYQVEPQSSVPHRESGRTLVLQVIDAPSFGYVRFDVVKRENAESPTYQLSLKETPRSELLTIANEYLRVTVDDRTSCISSIVELATGRELVNQQAVVGFNGYIYDTYGSAGENHNLALKLTGSPRLELLTGRSLARPSVILERVNDAVEQKLVYEYVADGINWARVTLRLRHGEQRLLIENRISKPKTTTKESAFFAFPFSFTNPTVRYEVTGGVTGDGINHVPGAPQYMHAVRNWVTFEEDETSVVWVTKEAPLIQPETIALPYAPFPDSLNPRQAGTLYSWIHNNLWDTNFPIEQGFEASYNYSIGVHDPEHSQSVEGLAIATAMDFTDPLVSVRATGKTDLSSTESLMSLTDDRVRLVSVSQPQDLEEKTVLVRLQSFSPTSITTQLRVPSDFSKAELVTYLNERPQPASLADGFVEVSLAPYAVLAVRLTRTTS